MRDVAPIQYALKSFLELATVIRPHALYRQPLWGDVFGNQRHERGRCVTLRGEIHHLEAGVAVHDIDDVAVPAETRGLNRPALLTKNRCPFPLARSFVIVGSACRLAFA